MTSENPRRSVRMLFAEDDDDDFLFIEEAIEEADLSNPYERVIDGTTLLARLRQREKPRPDIILLDLNMTPMNGFQALDHLRADPALCDIPVVVLTTSRVDEQRCLDRGVLEYNVKPTTQGDLIKIIKKVLNATLELIVE